MVAVIVFRGKVKAMKRFKDEEKGRCFFKVACERFGKDNTYLVSLTNAIAPTVEPYIPSKRGHLWCPYCGAERRFTLYPPWATSRCEICGISTAEFWVKQYNRLWGPSSNKKGKEGNKKERKKKEVKPKLLKRTLKRGK